MEHLSNDQEGHSNQYENSYKVCNEMGHPVVNLMECQWKLRQHESEFPNGGKAIVDQMLASEERNISERAEL